MTADLQMSARFESMVAATTSFAISPVPEASGAAMLLLGLIVVAGVVAFRRHRRGGRVPAVRALAAFALAAAHGLSYAGQVLLNAHAGEAGSIDTVGTVQRSQDASAGYDSPAGVPGSAQTVSLPAGSAAGAAIDAIDNSMRISTFANANSPCSLWCGANAHADFDIGIALAGWYQVTVHGALADPIEPGESSAAFSWSLGLGGADPLWSLSATDAIDQTQTLFIPANDYVLLGSTDAAASRMAPAMSAASWIAITQVPEPATWITLLAGLGVLVLVAKSRSRHRTEARWRRLVRSSTWRLRA